MDYIPEEVLNEWETKNNLSMQHVNVSSNEEIMDKLEIHEIDCFVSVEESKWSEFNISPVTNIGESDIYFAINKNRPDIKEALDNAMRRIYDDNPFYTDELYKKYLSADCSAFLSKTEKEWLEEHGRIKIGFLNNDTGVSVLEKIRAMEHPDAKTIPIISMTANAFKEDIDRCLEAGMNAHIISTPRSPEPNTRDR